MRQFKTIFFWVFVSLAFGAGVFAYFNLKNIKKPRLNAVSVLPDSCFVYLNSADFFELNKKINSQSLIADKLNLFSEVNDLLSTLQEFDSLFSTNELLKEELTANLIHFGVYESGWLLSFNLKQLGEQENITSYLSTLFHAEKTSADIFQFNLQSKRTLHFKLHQGVVLLSNTDQLISQAINSSRLKLEKNRLFLNFKNTLTENDLLSIYVNHSLYKRSTCSQKLNLNFICDKGISAGNVEFQPSQLNITGLFQPDSSEILFSFYEQETQSSKELSDYLPLNTAAFQAYGFSSYATLMRNIDPKDINNSYWETINKKALYNLKTDFEQNIGGHILQFQNSGDKNTLISLEIIDTLKSREHLLAMSDSSYVSDSIPIFILTLSENSDQLSLFKPLLTSETHFAALFSNHLIFAKNEMELIQTLNFLKKGRILSQDESFVAYMEQHFTDEFNFLMYTSPNQIKDQISSFFNFKTTVDSDPFQNFKHFSFCTSRNSGNFKFRMQILHESETKTNDQNTLWTLQLDNKAIIPAQGFSNHLSNENELLIQDEGYTLYLINAKGTILWRKKLTEKIQSKIYTVDIYKNGKYQMLFNTKKAIHLIDRNGNEVENYPTKLPSEASSELSLFDYDGNKDYRIFISCKNNFIYNYNIHGVKQEKFTSVRTEDEVNLPIQYIKIGLSDYLVAMDKEGKIYTFSRKGVGRIGLRNRAVADCKAFYCDLNNSISSSYIVYVDDKNALINKISLDDRKEIVKLNSETENANTNFKLIDDNRSMDLVLTKNNTIWSYNFSGNLISEINLETGLEQTEFYKDESHALYYSLSKDQTEVILRDILNQKTQILKGTSMPFVSNLFKDNKKYLILNNGPQLSCVPIN